jgi:hypothetical protein
MSSGDVGSVLYTWPAIIGSEGTGISKPKQNFNYLKICQHFLFGEGGGWGFARDGLFYFILFCFVFLGGGVGNFTF